jgi:cytochrome c551/c552
MNTGIKIFLFVIAVLAFYSYVGHTVPQKITYPPSTADLSGDMTVEELVDAGAQIVGGKGACLGCHTIGSTESSPRFPDLGNIGATAGTRIEGVSALEYLAQSLYDPAAYIVDGFLPGMPVISRPPIGLTDDEIIAVMAYLQSLGGTPNITLATTHSFTGQGASESSGAAPTVANAVGAGLDGKGVYDAYMCATCHHIDLPDRLVGPSLYDIGSRLTRAEIYEAVMDPDISVADGYPGQVMSTTLAASGFNQKVSAEEARLLVEFLVSQTGN